MSHSDCDVLIVGAGPVGTALALELALHQVSFRVVDSCAVRSDKSRAFVVHSRTLELMNRHGSAHELTRRGTEVHGMAIHINRKLVAVVNLDGACSIPTEYPLPLMVSQAETERFLDECLAQYGDGASVERPVTAKSITQDETGVTTVLESPDGKKETVRSKYVVGCDGAHSIVRHSAQTLTFDGAAYPQVFALCDARIRDSNVALDRLSMHLGSGLFAIIPLGDGLFRFVTMASRADSEIDDNLTDSEGNPKLAFFQREMERFTPPGCGTLYDAVWLTRFRLHHRGVNKYRDGRLFVAGDAAHIHSPVGGQGMNTGLHDAYNLGWKLAAVLQGQTGDPETLLDSYHAERHPVAQHLLTVTDKLFTSASSTNFLFTRVRNFILPWILPWFWSSRERTSAAYKFLSELNITYRGSLIVGNAEGFMGPIAGGDRAPDGELKKKMNTSAIGQEQTMTRVHHVCVGAPHHLLFFTGKGKDENSVPNSAIFEEASDKIQALVKNDMKTHVIGTVVLSDFANSSLSDSVYLDSDGVVHERYGFDKEPGYAFIRPDGHIAHIGLLSTMDDLLVFLGKYF